MKVGEGKSYRTRDGRKVKIGRVRKYDGVAYPEGENKIGDVACWWPDGCAHIDKETHPLDLIAEWVDEPQIEVGKTYPDRKGRKWECLFIRGDVAFMQMYGAGDAYRYKLDGTPISLVTYEEYTIDLGPVRGEVVKYFSEARDVAGHQHADSKYKATIPTLDGKPAVGTYTGENGLCVKIEEVE